MIICAYVGWSSHKGDMIFHGHPPIVAQRKNMELTARYGMDNPKRH